MTFRRLGLTCTLLLPFAALSGCVLDSKVGSNSSNSNGVGGAAGSSSGGTGTGGSSATGGTSSGGSAGSGGTTGIDYGPSCTAVAAAACTRIGSCSAKALQLFFGDQAFCQDRVGTICWLASNAPDSSLTNNDIDQSTAKIPTTSCEELLSGESPLPILPLTPGPRAVGQPCSTGYQCTTSYCSLPDGANCGTCASAPAAGSACDQGKDCAIGQRCLANQCQPMAGPGQACPTGACWQTLSCSNGTCGAAAKKGEACDTVGTGAPQCNLMDGLTCMASQCEEYGIATAGNSCGLIGAEAQVLYR